MSCSSLHSIFYYIQEEVIKMAKDREIVKDITGTPIAYIDHYDDGSTEVKSPTGGYLGVKERIGITK